MIPILILFGLVVGRWWRTTLVIATVAWPVVLVASDVMPVSWEIASAAGLALANTAVGVLVHQAFLQAVRGLRPGNHTSRSA